MADGLTTRPVQSGKTPEVQELDEFKFKSFGQGEQVNPLVTTQRKRVPKRSYANFGLTTLSLTKESATRNKKRNRKDDKRIVVDRVDGFTFISAFTLNDFDEYERNPVKRPLAPTKRKAGTKSESATSNKKVKKSVSSTPESLGTHVNAVKKGVSNMTPKKSPVPAPERKTVSPLTKSALVRLKKIRVSSLNKNNPVSKQTKDSSKGSSKNKSSFGKTKKSINLKVPLMKIGPTKNSNKIPHMQIDKPTLDGDKTIITLSDDEDNLELDVCGVDEHSSSQFILSNMNKPKSGSEESKNDETRKPKKKPCRVCCAYPCRIVGAKKIKPSRNQFPSFDVSYTSRCQVHTPGEILLNEPSDGKANVCIQTTFTDIRMHLDFARRFPYRTISVVSCQPSLYDDDLKLPYNLENGTNQRCSENHRILEQKRREELHGLYCKLADTLSISKNRASKQWILENALKELKSLEAKDEILTANLNLEKSENDKKRKRWEELAGKPYVAPESTSKSKLMELFQQYRQERDMCPIKGEEEIKFNVKRELQKKIKKSQSKKFYDNSGKQKLCSKPAAMLSSASTPEPNNLAACEQQSVTPAYTSISILKPSGAAENPTSSKNFILVNNSPMSTSHSGPEIKSTQPISIGTVITTVKQTPSLGPSQVVRPFMPGSSRSPSNPAIPKVDLTTESSPNQAVSQIPKSNPLSELSQLLTRNPNLAPSTSNTPLQNHATAKLLKSPPPNQNSALPQTATQLFSTQIAQKPNLAPSVDLNMDCVIVTMVVNRKKMVFRIPKTTEGLTLLNRLSSLNMLSPDSFKKIAAQFPVNQSGQSANTTTTLRTSPATPTQWSAVALGPSMSIIETARSEKESIVPGTSNNNGDASTIRPTNLPTSTQSLKPNSETFATISRPIKEPVARTVKTSSDNMGTASRAKQDNVIKVGNSKDVSVSGKIKPSNAVGPSEVVDTCQAKGNDVPQQPKVILFDLTKNNKAQAKPFTVIPASSSINVTLNKLGSITANKVYNKSPASVQSKAAPISTSPPSSATKTNPQNTNSVTTSTPSTSQTIPRNTNITTASTSSTSRTQNKNTSSIRSTSQTNKPNYGYRAIPVRILPKYLPVQVTNVFKTIQNVPVSISNIPIHPFPQARIPSDEPPDDLPEIPPDIPNDLTRASLSPLQTIPEISDSLLDDTCKKDVDNVNEPGFCVISNVFSLTGTTESATPNNLEKTPNPVVDKDVSDDSSMTVTTDKDIVH